MTKTKKTLRTTRGFTLIEVVVVSVLTALLFGAVSYAITSFYKTNAYAIEQAMAINFARKGIESLVKDIREASYSDEGSYPIISIATTTFEFYSDVEGNSNIEKIRYFIQDGYFKKGVTFSAGTPLSYTGQPEMEYIIAENMRNEDLLTNVFTYYDSNGVEVVDFVGGMLDVVFVEMSVTININPRRLPSNYTLYSSATMRNIVNAL